MADIFLLLFLDRNPEFEPRTSINPSAKAGDSLPGSGLPALSDPVYNENARAARPTAAETLNGADSRQLHDGIGHPGAGQTSAEVCASHLDSCLSPVLYIYGSGIPY